MRCYTVIIDRDAVQKTACEKWAADLPILRAMYGDEGAVVVVGYHEVEAERSADEEYERLRKTYGLKDGNVPWVEYVYGRSLSALERAMQGDELDEEDLVEVKPPTTSAEPKKAKAKPKKAAAAK